MGDVTFWIMSVLLFMGSLLVILCVLVRWGFVDIRLTQPGATTSGGATRSVTERGVQTYGSAAARRLNLFTVISLRDLTVEGLRVPWSHVQLGATKHLLMADLQQGFAQHLGRGSFKIVILSREHAE